jgi:hypothetical protein
MPEGLKQKRTSPSTEEKWLERSERADTNSTMYYVNEYSTAILCSTLQSAVRLCN